MSDTTSPLASGSVPPPIARALRRLIHRVRGLILLRGVSAVVATGLGTLLLVMAIDAGFTLFSQTLRWVLTLSALAITVAVAMWLLILPMAKTITLTGIARAIETRHPELQERLSSAVELLTSRDIPEIRGSETLIAALAAEATQDAGRVKPRAEVPLKAARPYVLAALLVLAVFGSLWVLVDPDITSRLLKRAVAPFMNLPNISADMLVVTPGDAILAEGQRLEIQVEVRNAAVKRCSLRKALPDGSERSAYMTSLPASEEGYPRFTVTCSPAAEDFRYRVHAGDALTRFYDVTVVPPALVKRLDVHYAYPAYTQRPPKTETDVPGDIRAVAGTKVTVTATTNKPIKSADVRLNGRAAKGIPTQILPGPSGTTVCKFQVDLKPRMRGRWALAMTDEYGFSNTSPDRQIVALPDKPPTVKILNPEVKKLRLKPSDRLPVQFSMTDDFGLAKAEFVVATDTRKGAKVPISLPADPDTPNQTAAGETPLLLSKLPLRGATQFTFRLRAADNRPPDLKGPGEGSSRSILVELDLAAESYAMQTLKSQEQTFRTALERILHELEQTKEDSVPVKEQVAKREELTKGLAERVDRMREHLGQAKATAAEIAPQAAESAFAGLEPGIKEVESEVAAAEDKTGQVKLADTAADRGTAAAEADQHVDKAIDATKGLLEQLDQMAEAVQLAQALSDMATQEAALAAEAAMDQIPGEWQQAQDQLAGEVGELVADFPAAQQAQLARDQQAAQDLAAQARELQQEQLGLAEDTGQLAQLGQIDQALENLAAEQAQLAREAGATPIAADQQPPMAQAAENIRAAALPQAIAQQKRAEQALAARAQGQQPAGQQAGGEQPAGQQAGGEQPAGQQAGGEQPAGQQAGGEQPAGQQAGGEQPAGQQAGGEQPAGQQAGGEQPAGQQAGGEQPAGQQAGGQQPAGQQAGGEQPAGQQAGGEQPAGQQAGGEQPAGQQAGGQQPSPQDRQQAAELGARQQDIRERTEELLAQRTQLAQQMIDSRMARLQAEQAQLAREATELAENVAPVGGEAGQLGEQAAHDAQAAAQQLPSDIGAAAQSAGSAAEELGGLSENLAGQAAQQAGGEPPSGQPASGEPSSGEPTSGEPSSGEPSSGEPSAGEPSGGEPSSGQPSSGQPSSGQPSSGQPSSGQPSGGEVAQMAQQAGDLAERQEQLAAEMAALAQQSPQQALAAAQQGLADQTGALQEAAAALGQRAEAMAPATAAAAGEATQALGEAQDFAEQAAGQLGQAGQEGGQPAASPQAAQGSQQSAAEALGQAAEALSGLGQALAQAAQGMPTPSAGEAAMGQPMAEGYSAATEAAAGQSAPSAAQAAQALSQAASQAAAMAQAMGAQPGMGMGMAMRPGMMPTQTLNSQFGIGPIGISLTAAKLQGLGIKLSDWARLPGELRNQILQAAEEGGPEEYRVLIKRYFQKVAKKGGEKGEESK